MQDARNEVPYAEVAPALVVQVQVQRWKGRCLSSLSFSDARSSKQVWREGFRRVGVHPVV